VTASFRVLYVFAAMEIGSRRILHCNMTEHPTAEWTIQQFREFLAFDHPYRFVVHERDSIFSLRLDQALNGFGVRALKTPVRTPQANAFCERLVGTIRRECFDFLIPINERHVRILLREFTSRILLGEEGRLNRPTEIIADHSWLECLFGGAQGDHFLETVLGLSPVSSGASKLAEKGQRLLGVMFPPECRCAQPTPAPRVFAQGR